MALNRQKWKGPKSAKQSNPQRTTGRRSQEAYGQVVGGIDRDSGGWRVNATSQFGRESDLPGRERPAARTALGRPCQLRTPNRCCLRNGIFRPVQARPQATILSQLVHTKFHSSKLSIANTSYFAPPFPNPSTRNCWQNGLSLQSISSTYFCRPIEVMFADFNPQGALKYVEELQKRKQSDVLRFLLRVRCWEVSL